MPTAQYGEPVSQASIAACVGAVHWSKPKPVKLPGVTTLAAPAGAASPTVAASRAIVASTDATTPAGRRTGRGTLIGTLGCLARGPHSTRKSSGCPGREPGPDPASDDAGPLHAVVALVALDGRHRAGLEDAGDRQARTVGGVQRPLEAAHR